MILAVCLLVLSVALLGLGPRVIARWTSGVRSPLASLVAWQLASWLLVGMVLLAAALLAVPPLAAAGRLPASLESCLAMLRDLPNPADSVVLQVVAGLVLVCALLRLLGCALRSAVANHRHRARHRALLCLVGRPDAALGAHIVSDPAAIVYCLPGHGGRVVFSSGAVDKLSPVQRAAVLAHERAHLRGRHHLLIASASVLSRSFPRVTLFSKAFEQTTRLVEMRADDLASLGHGRRPVAEALLALTGVTGSAVVLAASAVATADRIVRLLADPPPHPAARLAHTNRAVGATLAASVLAGSPMLLAIAGYAVLCLL